MSSYMPKHGGNEKRIKIFSPENREGRGGGDFSYLCMMVGSEVKIKFPVCGSRRHIEGSRGIDPLIPKLGTGWS
jgi:hypothetical protein